MTADEEPEDLRERVQQEAGTETTETLLAFFELDKRSEEVMVLSEWLV